MKLTVAFGARRLSVRRSAAEEMKLEIDPRVVEKLAEEREDANWKFRTFLKGIDLETGELNALVHKHYEEVVGQIDCCACANCCREVTPILQEHDVDRLAKGLNVSREEVIERFLLTDEDGDVIFRDRPCPVLSENCCSVYEYRPDDCRSFPHLHKDEFVFCLIQAVQNCSVCPIVFNVFERLKNELWHVPEDTWNQELD